LGLPKPPNKFPREEPSDIARFSTWVERYDEACRDFCTCTLLESFGGGNTVDDVAQVVEMHDKFTGATSGNGELA
jgi:hypothetical protein